MGVSGCGKSTVGRLLAEALGGDFAEGDAFHPAANVAKMAAGNPLDDDDRGPWLAAMTAAIGGWSRKGTPTVLSCSALKQCYRDTLRGDALDVVFVHLAGSRETIAARLAARLDHYMPAGLLDSQFAALEAPDETDAIVVSVDGEPRSIVATIVERLRDWPVIPA